MKVYVKREDIENGERGKAMRCPLALALKRKLKRVVSVDHDSVAVRGATIFTSTLHDIASAAMRFTDRFDCGKPVKPGWVEVWK